MKLILRLFFVFLATMSWLAAAQLPDWSVRTGSGDSMTLNTLFAKHNGTLIAVVAATTQDSGQAQLKILLQAHQQLADSETNVAPVYHLNIIAGAPRLVQGFIRRGIAGEYDSPVTEDTVLLAFPDSNDSYVAQTGFEVDDIATWFWVDRSGQIVSSFKMIDSSKTSEFLAWYRSL